MQEDNIFSICNSIGEFLIFCRLSHQIFFSAPLLTVKPPDCRHTLQHWWRVRWSLIGQAGREKHPIWKEDKRTDKHSSSLAVILSDCTCFSVTRPSLGTCIYKNIEKIVYCTLNVMSIIDVSFFYKIVWPFCWWHWIISWLISCSAKCSVQIALVLLKTCKFEVFCWWWYANKVHLLCA